MISALFMITRVGFRKLVFYRRQRDGIDDIHTDDYISEHAIPNVSFALAVQKSVIDKVDIKLGRSGIGVGSSRHSDGAPQVAAIIVAFINNRWIRRHNVSVIAYHEVSAALDNKTCDDAVEDKVTVKTGPYILEKILDGYRRIIIVKLYRDITKIGLDTGRAGSPPDWVQEKICRQVKMQREILFSHPSSN